MALGDRKRKDKPQSFPEIAPKDKIGVTEEEKTWAAKKPPRPHVPHYVFISIAIFFLLAFAGGGFWYHRKNILPEKYYMRAEAQFNAEKYQEAFALYEKAAKIQPDRRDIYNNMARTQVRLGDVDNAINCYEAHLKKQPDDAKASLEAAELYVDKKNYDRAIELLSKTAYKLGGGGEAAERLAEVELLAGYQDRATDTLGKAAAAYGDPEKVIDLAKKLMTLGDYMRALDAYHRATKLAPDDTRGLHGANAARAMLGIPTDPAMIITPGVSLGSVKLGASKDEVKSVMGSPEQKTFTKISRIDLEIWNYGITDRKRSMAIFFTGGKVKEIETRYYGFKTEAGLGAGNFLLEKHQDKISERVRLDDGRTLFDVKGGGISLYAAGINEAGNNAKFAKLILHKNGEKPVGESQLSWIEKIMSR